MATDPVASTLPSGYAVEPPTVATLKATDVAATHELGPNGIAAKSSPTLPPGYSIEGQTSDKPLPPGAVITPAPAGTAAAGADVKPSLKEHVSEFGQAVEQGVVGASALGSTLIGGSEAAAGIKAGIRAVTAPSATAETVGTGILDSAGEEIMREGMKYGPSALAKALAHPLGKVILHKAFEGGIGAVGGAAVWKALKLLGIF